MSGELITADGQMQYGSLLMGTGTPYRIAPGGLRGWEGLPPLDQSDVPRPSAAGAWPGSILPGERIIETDLNLFVADTSTYSAALAALRAATAPSDSEQPLVIRMGGQLLQCGVRCTGRLGGEDGYAIGADRVALKWTASDPRRYSSTAASATTAPPTAGSGLTWPITWSLSWGTSGSGGTVNIVNSGDWNTPLTITITGPLTTPAVYRLDTGAVLELNTALVASDVVVIDTLNDTLTLNGTSAKGLLSDRSAPVNSFLMPPGATGLALRAAVTNAAASMGVVWRSAYL